MRITDQYREEAIQMRISSDPSQGKCAWQSPSNIAIIKYWGKRPGQFPMNPSLSLTLGDACTRMHVDYHYSRSNTELRLRYFFEGQENRKFGDRMLKYLYNLQKFLPYLPYLDLEIHSENTFPHSSGIASSASAFSALAMCLVEIEQQLCDKQHSEESHRRKASFLARLGSGSASRSVYGGISVWGEFREIPQASNEIAVPLEEGIDPVYNSFHDTILILDAGIKEISSSEGHQMMEHNPFADKRFQQARDNLRSLLPALQEGDLKVFMEIMEYEALSLHAMMMTSKPGYLLLKKDSLSAIEKIRTFRKDTGMPVGFTIDAGANLHVLYPHEILIKADEFINAELRPLCHEGRLINDRVGTGPQRISG